MRFKANIHNASAFHKFAASLSTLGNVAWVRLSSDDVRFTIIPESGSQVWAQLSIDSVFETYTIQSATENNTINLEVPLQPLLRALKSASNATSASIRLTKKDGAPWLVMTIITTSFSAMSTTSTNNAKPNARHANENENEDDPFADPTSLPEETQIPNPAISTTSHRERETHITLDIPVVVLAPGVVSGLHEPRCREPDVHIYLPPLQQLKSISDRFARLASSGDGGGNGGNAGFGAAGGGIGGANRFRGAGVGTGTGISAKGPKLDLAATMHGTLRLSLPSSSSSSSNTNNTSSHLAISSTWRGLENPELDARQIEGGEDALARHPSTRMREVMPSEDDEGPGWAKVRIDARDWSRVLGVGRVGGRVVGCFCKDHALILYCYMPTSSASTTIGNSGLGDESVITYYISSISR